VAAAANKINKLFLIGGILSLAVGLGGRCFLKVLAYHAVRKCKRPHMNAYFPDLWQECSNAQESVNVIVNSLSKFHELITARR
jgi:hypothetical protein